MASWRARLQFKAAHFGKQVRSNILYGVFILLPMAVTIFIIVKLFHVMDSWIYLVTPQSLRGRIVPGMGVVVLLVGTYGLGLFARNYFGRRLLHLGNMVIKRIPLINKLYGVLKQVVDAVASPKKKVLDKVVLIEFPHKGSYCLAFVTSRENSAVSKATGSEMISVFLPKVPNPASGFLFYVPASKVVEVDISMETALKLIMSAGVVTPDKKDTPGQTVRLEDFPSLLSIFKPPKKEMLDPRD
ncbi:MAG TPA: DUF502 domain-containing protein [Chitinivibrionales bacterium]